jgi:hypothetical protein
MRSRSTVRTDRSIPRWVAVALCVALVVPAGGTLAQSVEEQAGALAERGESLAEDTRDDPGAMASNATDPSWQGSQTNRTIVWTCDTASAVKEDVGERVREELDCDERENAIAENDPDEEEQQEQAEEDVNETQADADEAEQDAETAARDQAAVTREFVKDTREAPDEAPSHVSTFVNRTRAILERLVGGLAGVGAAGVDGAHAVGSGVSTATSTVTDGVATAAGTIGTTTAVGVQTSVDAVQTAGVATIHGVQAGADATGSGIAWAASGAGSAVEVGVNGLEQAASSALGAVESVFGSDDAEPVGTERGPGVDAAPVSEGAPGRVGDVVEQAPEP